METIYEEIKSPPADTFAERMMRRNSSMTLLRRRKILRAIEDDNTEETSRNSLYSSSLRRNNDLNLRLNELKIEEEEEKEEICEVKEDNPEVKIIDEDTETPRAKRRCQRPDLESTRIFPTLESEEIDEVLVIPDIVKDHDHRIPYEVERFLTDALGDEHNNTGIEQMEEQEKNETISEKVKPFFKRMTKFWQNKRNNDFSIINEDEISRTSRNRSGTLDRSVDLYRTLSQRIKKKIRSALIKTPEPDTQIDPLRPLSFDKERMDKMDEILQQMKIQQTTIEQASKALTLCRSNKEFLGSSEEVESERLLLLAVIRKRLLQEELKKLSDTSENQIDLEDPSAMTEWAEVTIENINLSLRDCSRRESGEPMEWFMVVIIEGINAWGSSPVLRPGSMILDISNFSTKIDHLKPTFKITIEVYCLNKSSGLHDESHGNMTLNRTWTYLSPTKFWKKSDKSLSPKNPQDQGIRSPSFGKCGYLELGLHDLTVSSPWTLSSVPHDSVLRGIIDLNLSCKLHLSDCHQGFLNYGEETGGFLTWNTRWCVLKGCTLMFWNYPRDQETKAPIKSIDLMLCFSEKICRVDRELCARARTVVVETVRPREAGDVDSVLVECRGGHTFQRHLLSFDNKKDVIEWTAKLNNVISALRDWNVKFMKSNRKSGMIPNL